jgi:hypothetical protein
MRETINEEVSVVMYYSAKKREALPWRIRIQNTRTPQGILALAKKQ